MNVILVFGAIRGAPSNMEEEDQDQDEAERTGVIDSSHERF